MSLLNRKAMREFLLNRAKETRFHAFTRVSAETMDVLEVRLKDRLVELCDEHIKRQPSKGTTL